MDSAPLSFTIQAYIHARSDDLEMESFSEDISDGAGFTSFLARFTERKHSFYNGPENNSYYAIAIIKFSDGINGYDENSLMDVIISVLMSSGFSSFDNYYNSNTGTGRIEFNYTTIHNESFAFFGFDTNGYYPEPQDLLIVSQRGDVTTSGFIFSL
jgi:hypothetical protein